MEMPSERLPAPWSLRLRIPIVAAWFLIAILAAPFALHVTEGLSSGGFEAPGSPAVWADRQVAKLAPPATAQPELITRLPFGELTTLARRDGIAPGWLHQLGGEAAVLIAPAALPRAALYTFLRAVRANGGSYRQVDGTEIGHELSRDSESTLHTSTAIALPILLLLLLLVFGSIASAVLPLVVALVGSELTLAVVDVLEHHITLSIYLTDIVTFLALGVGVDYSLFIATRFRQALREGRPVAEAMRVAMASAGRSVFFSGLAVALAMGTLVLGGTAYWNGLALGGAIAVVSVLLATHSLLPALLSFLGPGIEWGRLPRLSRREWLWPRLARFGTGMPWLALPLGVLLLLVPALFGPELHMAIPADLASMLPKSSLLRRASEEVQRVRGQGSIAPFAVVLRLPTTIRQTASWRTVAGLAAAASRLPDVAAVSSPTRLGLDPETLALLWRSPVPFLQPYRTALMAFVAPQRDPHLFTFFVTAKGDPDSPTTHRLYEQLQNLLRREAPPGARAAIGGAVAVLAGFDRWTADRLPWVIGGVALVAFGVLSVATGSLLQAFLGVLMDALVALATAGVLVLTVQRGALGLEAQPVNTAVTPLIFVLLFGLSMDYEVILLHRIQEALAQGLPMREAARQGIEATGSMITGAGLIMVVVFIVLLVSPLEILKTLGIGMTIAILLDTWIVRTFLVPGAVAAFGPWAFWPRRERRTDR